MEDVQDGIRVSIQDGVEEDPATAGLYELSGKSFAGLIAVQKEMGNPEITSSVTTDSEDKGLTLTIVSIVGTAVV